MLLPSASAVTTRLYCPVRFSEYATEDPSGDAFLTPGWTDYGQRVLYQTYDVTGLLRDGENVLGAVLGDGWDAGFVGFDAKRAGAHYGPAPELLAQLDITLEDGTTSRVVRSTCGRG